MSAVHPDIRSFLVGIDRSKDGVTVTYALPERPDFQDGGFVTLPEVSATVTLTIQQADAWSREVAASEGYDPHTAQLKLPEQDAALMIETDSDGSSVHLLQVGECVIGGVIGRKDPEATRCLAAAFDGRLFSDDEAPILPAELATARLHEDAVGRGCRGDAAGAVAMIENLTRIEASYAGARDTRPVDAQLYVSSQSSTGRHLVRAASGHHSICFAATTAQVDALCEVLTGHAADPAALHAAFWDSPCQVRIEDAAVRLSVDSGAVEVELRPGLIVSTTGATVEA